MSQAVNSQKNDPQSKDSAPTVRIDSWLWAARFFKTRSLAKSAVEGGKVHVNKQRVKPAKPAQVGQIVEIRKGDSVFTVTILALARQRGPASIAATLYQESDESIESRALVSSRRRMERAGLTVPAMRPTKKQRRELTRLKHQVEDGDHDNWDESPTDNDEYQ